MVLEHELEVFRKELPRLLTEGKAGSYVVIHQDTVAGMHQTFLEAMEAGHTRFGLGPFLVKKVEAVETIRVFARHIRPCPS
jgi:hypothetical protein